MPGNAGTSYEEYVLVPVQHGMEENRSRCGVSDDVTLVGTQRTNKAGRQASRQATDVLYGTGT